MAKKGVVVIPPLTTNMYGHTASSQGQGGAGGSSAPKAIHVVQLVPGSASTTNGLSHRQPHSRNEEILPINQPEASVVDIPNEQQQQQQPAKQLTPRGKHKYPPMHKWKLYQILAVLAFVLAFLALLFVAILYWRDSGAHHEFRSEMAQRIDGLKDSYEGVVSAMRKRETRFADGIGVGAGAGGGAGSIDFALEADIGKYTRWPSSGGIEGVNFGRLAETRLCCMDSQKEYFICGGGDVGSASSSTTMMMITADVSLSSLVTHDKITGDAYLLVHVNHDRMQGSLCTFSWRNKPRSR